MFRMKFVTAASIGLGGYLAGLSTERFSNFFKKNVYDHENKANEDFIRPMPGLPIFGTVSAASIVPAKNEPKSIPPEPHYNAPRVSQVL